jgi:hypothetical protein
MNSSQTLSGALTAKSAAIAIRRESQRLHRRGERLTMVHKQRCCAIASCQPGNNAGGAADDRTGQAAMAAAPAITLRRLMVMVSGSA